MIKISSMVGTPDLTAPVLAPYSGDLQAAGRAALHKRFLHEAHVAGVVVDDEDVKKILSRCRVHRLLFHCKKFSRVF